MVKLYSLLVITVDLRVLSVNKKDNRKCKKVGYFLRKPKTLRVTTKLLVFGMRNF